MIGLVIEKNANLFTVESHGKNYILKPSGKTKSAGIFVGDNVEFDQNITEVKPRKNILIRPPLANIDKMFITISPSPKPDYLLLDKMLIYCTLNDIQPLILVNKSDILSDEEWNKILNSYGRFYKVIKISAKQGNLDLIKNEIQGICALAGQSAVGKSSVINALFGQEKTQVGQLSKIQRGRQTTRLVKLYKFEKGYIADTAGFSLLDLSFVSKINADELSSYYPDFLTARAECKYRSCIHTTGGQCGVIKWLKNGNISQLRYQNYLKILNELKNSKKF